MLLAPVIKERKGEHTKTLENPAGGAISAPVSTEKSVTFPIRPSRLQKKHTIEVVIDRFKVRDDLPNDWRNPLKPRWNCPAARRSLPIWTIRKRKSCCSPPTSPALSAAIACANWNRGCFSFNNPAGACPTCDGLGVQQYFDPDRVIQNPELSLAGGAIRGWDRRNFYYFQMLKSLAEHYKFDVEAPWPA